MAPEVVTGELYNASADVYSFGVLLFAITCAMSETSNKTPYQIFYEVAMESRRENESMVSKESGGSTVNIDAVALDTISNAEAGDKAAETTNSNDTNTSKVS